MRIITMTRSEAIDRIVREEVSDMNWNYLRDILKNGFDGYNSFTNEELEVMYYTMFQSEFNIEIKIEVTD